MGVSPHAECVDAQRLIGELVYDVKAGMDNVIVRIVDAVRELILAHELPDVLDRVELRHLAGGVSVMCAGTTS